MAGGGRVGGQGSLVQRGIWVFVACCIVVAVWNSFPHTPKGFYEELGHKSEQLKGVAGDAVDWMAGAFGGGGEQGGTEAPKKVKDKTGDKGKPGSR